MEKMTKEEMYQLLIGLIAAAVWAFGKKWELPADMITFAGTAVVAIAGHAVGLNSAKPAAQADTQVIQAAAPDAAIPVAAADPNVPK